MVNRASSGQGKVGREGDTVFPQVLAMRKCENDGGVLGEQNFGGQFHFFLQFDGMVAHLFDVLAHRHYFQQCSLQVQIVAVLIVCFLHQILCVTPSNISCLRVTLPFKEEREREGKENNWKKRRRRDKGNPQRGEE